MKKDYVNFSNIFLHVDKRTNFFQRFKNPCLFCTLLFLLLLFLRRDNTLSNPQRDFVLKLLNFVMSQKNCYGPQVAMVLLWAPSSPLVLQTCLLGNGRRTSSMPTEDGSLSSGVGTLVMSSSYGNGDQPSLCFFLEQLASNSLGIQLQYEVCPSQMN